MDTFVVAAALGMRRLPPPSRLRVRMPHVEEPESFPRCGGCPFCAPDDSTGNSPTSQNALMTEEPGKALGQMAEDTRIAREGIEAELKEDVEKVRGEGGQPKRPRWKVWART
jgi:hypothetical protein